MEITANTIIISHLSTQALRLHCGGNVLPEKMVERTPLACIKNSTPGKPRLLDGPCDSNVLAGMSAEYYTMQHTVLLSLSRRHL